MTENSTALLQEWLLRASRKAHAHALAAATSRAIHNWIGIPSVILATVVGAAVFVEVSRTATGPGKWIVIFMVLSSAALSGAQTFLRFGEREVLHNDCRGKFAAIRREIEVSITKPAKERHAALEKLTSRFAEIHEPHIPGSIWRKAEALYPTPRPAG
ncbi:MAG TPA: SLATT domain-containing protein [Terrimicrobiaceae bacterium]